MQLTDSIYQPRTKYEKKLTSNVRRIWDKSICVLPLMFSTCKLVKQWTACGSNRINLLYDKSRYVRLVKLSNAAFGTFAKRLYDKSVEIFFCYNSILFLSNSIYWVDFVDFFRSNGLISIALKIWHRKCFYYVACRRILSKIELAISEKVLKRLSEWTLYYDLSASSRKIWRSKEL